MFETTVDDKRQWKNSKCDQRWRDIERSCQQADSLGVRLMRQGLSPGCTPDGRTEVDLVDEVSQIVDQVEGSVRDLAQQVTKVVTQRVDGPPKRHNDAHEVEGVGHSWTQIILGGRACGTNKDLSEDEGPTTHATAEPN